MPDFTPHTLRLQGQLSIEQAHALHEQFRSICDACRTSKDPLLRMDGHAVQQIDTAGLQLLVGLIRTLQEQGISWTWEGLSPCLEQAIRLAGLEKVLLNASLGGHHGNDSGSG